MGLSLEGLLSLLISLLSPIPLPPRPHCFGWWPWEESSGRLVCGAVCATVCSPGLVAGAGWCERSGRVLLLGGIVEGIVTWAGLFWGCDVSGEGKVILAGRLLGCYGSGEGVVMIWVWGGSGRCTTVAGGILGRGCMVLSMWCIWGGREW